MQQSSATQATGTGPGPSQMYTSFLNKSSNLQGSSRGMRQSKRETTIRNAAAVPTRAELASEMQTPGYLKIGQRVLQGNAVVKRVSKDTEYIASSDTEYVIYHEDFRQEFILRKLHREEDITRWIDLQVHSNIVTAFDSFTEEISDTQFAMVEKNKDGNIYQHIKQMNLNLAIDVPRSYIEMIYDVVIQLAQGMDFAHNSGLVHGQFDLSKVVLEIENENIIYKITDFAPKTSVEGEINTKASYWPFSKQKTKITEREKQEVIMLKDIYTLGIAILELMIGRTSKQTFSISLDSLPLTWAEFPESTPLIQVLVQCIQIDSITERKGRLQGIKKLLTREYKKYFQKNIYKMENPFIGKRADVYNKRGIVALFRDQERLAEHWWDQALHLSDRHFDSQCNSRIHRWTNGSISDATLMAEMESYVFTVPGKGETLRAYLLIAMGWREEGMEELTQFIANNEAGLKLETRLQNLKKNKVLKQAQDVFDVIQLNRAQFQQNGSVKHEHREPLTDLQFSEGGDYLISASSDVCKVWKFVQNRLSKIIEIPGSTNDENREQNVQTIAAMNKACTAAAIYRGKLQFNLYELRDEDNYQKKQTIDLVSLLNKSRVEGFQFAPQRDQIYKLKFIGGDAPSHLRIYMIIGGEKFVANAALNNSEASFAPYQNYSDEPIFTVDQRNLSPQMQSRQQNMQNLIAAQAQLGNEVLFPSEDMRMVVVYSKEDPTEKHYKVFDNMRNQFVRKVAKKTMHQDPTAVDSLGSTLIFIEDDELIIRSIRMPNNATLMDNLRPRIAVAESKLNPALQAMNRQTYKDKLFRELHAYHMFKENARADKALKLTEQQNIHLMVLKYEEGVNPNNRYKLKANRELMMLQKILLADAKAVRPPQKDLQAQCPLVGVQGVKRIEIYDDELTFSSPLSRIDDVAMSSEPHRNFFLIAMDGLVYKYDLVSKELLFQFHTNATVIHMYDADDKLVVASENEIRLWDFYDHKEEAPELITVEQMIQQPGQQEAFKIEKVFINKNSQSKILCVLVTCKNKFILYTGRLEVKFTETLDNANEHITAGAFNKDSTLLAIGTSAGRVISYRIETGQAEGNPLQVSQNMAVTMLTTLQNVYDNDVYLMEVGDKSLHVYVQNRNEVKDVDFGPDGQIYKGEDICKMQVASNNKFFMAGIPSKNVLGFFSFNHETLQATPLMWLNKYPFETFYADDHLSTMMLIDAERRTLDFQYILWHFDTSNLDLVTLKKLDNKTGHTEKEDDWEEDAEIMQGQTRVVEQSHGSSCCTIF